MYNIMLCVQKLIREASDGSAFSDTSYRLEDGTRNYTGVANSYSKILVQDVSPTHNYTCTDCMYLWDLVNTLAS